MPEIASPNSNTNRDSTQSSYQSHESIIEREEEKKRIGPCGYADATRLVCGRDATGTRTRRNQSWGVLQPDRDGSFMNVARWYGLNRAFVCPPPRRQHKKQREK
jgi:hypothetical protein